MVGELETTPKQNQMEGTACRMLGMWDDWVSLLSLIMSIWRCKKESRWSGAVTCLLPKKHVVPPDIGLLFQPSLGQCIHLLDRTWPNLSASECYRRSSLGLLASVREERYFEVPRDLRTPTVLGGVHCRSRVLEELIVCRTFWTWKMERMCPKSQARRPLFWHFWVVTTCYNHHVYFKRCSTGSQGQPRKRRLGP